MAYSDTEMLQLIKMLGDAATKAVSDLPLTIDSQLTLKRIVGAALLSEVLRNPALGLQLVAESDIVGDEEDIRESRDLKRL